MSVLDYEVPLWAGVLALLVVGVGVDWWMARRDTRRRQAASLTWGGVVQRRPVLAQPKPAIPPTITPWMVWHGDIHRELYEFGVDPAEPGIRIVARDERAIVDCLMGARTVEEVA